MSFECEDWEMSSTPTKDVFAIFSYEEWKLRKAVATETGGLLLEKYTILEHPVSHENCYCENIGWFHLCDDVKEMSLDSTTQKTMMAGMLLQKRCLSEV